MRKNLIVIVILNIFIIKGLVFPAFGEETLAKQKAQYRLITISEGIKIVLKDNRLLKIALLDNEQAYQDSLVARSVLLPQGNALGWQTFYQFKPAAKFDALNVNTSNKDFFSFSLDVYQTLFDFGKNIFNYRASKELFKARQANTESIKRVATLEFIVAYFNLLEAEKMIVVFEKEVESLNAYLNDAEHLYEQGSAVKNDLLPAQVRLADARQKLIAARNAKEVAVAQLNNILSFPLRESVEAQDIGMQPVEPPELENAWNIAGRQRPEIVFFEDQIQASSLSERAKAVENFPIFFADAGYAYSENDYQVHEDNVSFQLGAKMNFYDGGRAKADLLKERARQKQLNEQKEKIIEDIKLEIEDSLLGLKNASEKLTVGKDAVSQAEENVRFYRVKYNAGSATSTEVLEAITLETIAHTNYFNDDYELKRSYAKLMYSMGVDLSLIYERMEEKQDESAKQ